MIGMRGPDFLGCSPCEYMYSADDPTCMLFIRQSDGWFHPRMSHGDMALVLLLHDESPPTNIIDLYIIKNILPGLGLSFRTGRW